jgi:uncharacterized protein YbaA (DUF1428 family)
MYTSIYIYRISRSNVEAFLRIQQEAADIYKHYGALDDETFSPVDLTAKYGCLAFTDVLELAEDEVLLIGLSRFKSRAHHDEVMAKVDADERINRLFEEVTGVLDISRLVRGEFERKI